MSAKNNGKAWSTEDNGLLRKLAKGNTPTRVIALKMGRTPSSVSSQASRQNVGLKPVNQSPYGTKKK